MMSSSCIRGVWVISSDRTQCLFSRRWPTVERRLKLAGGPTYSSLPSDKDLLDTVSFQPSVRLERGGLLFVAAPADTSSSSLALALLDSLASVVLNTNPPATSEAALFLSCSAPFGSPLDLSPANVTAQLLSRASQSPELGKAPSWAASSYKGSPRITLGLKEELCAVQYDQSGVSDSWCLSGTLYCKAEIEGPHDIQVSLTTPTPLQDLVYHPVVQSHGRGIRFSCSAPQNFPVAHYTCHLPSLPIRGFYQMKGENSVRLLIQLKLAEGVKNNFEWCEVRVPFFNRGSIQRVDNVVPASLAGSLAASGSTLVWSIGGKFPSKSLQVSLQATVALSGGPCHTDSPFHVSSNSYIEVLFKMSDFTLSQATIDSKSVTLLPPSLKPRISISREVSSRSYKIWNSHGESLAVFPQNRPS